MRKTNKQNSIKHCLIRYLSPFFSLSIKRKVNKHEACEQQKEKEKKSKKKTIATITANQILITE